MKKINLFIFIVLPICISLSVGLACWYYNCSDPFLTAVCVLAVWVIIVGPIIDLISFFKSKIWRKNGGTQSIE